MGTLVTDSNGKPLYFTGDSPMKPSGDVMDYKETVLSSASEVTLTTATAKNVTSVTLPNGEWDVNGIIDFDLTGATVTKMIAGVSTTTNTLGAQDTATQTLIALTTITGVHTQQTTDNRLILTAASTVVYLVASATFSAGTMKAFGTIRARRIR